MEFWFIISATIVAVASVLVYATIAVFFPEWVGITGKVALNAEQSHQAGSTPQTTSWIEDQK
ncbi:hypothetical protein [Bdellovibrio sp. HCB2-146]|uniref:hypothetical protein n=1 Tax=Bdellovibrio sp. HCB2-146 TaxID=3394362 RepID=UPI0039BD697A